MFLHSLWRGMTGPSYIRFQMRVVMQVFYLGTSFKDAELIPGLSGPAAESHWQRLIKMGPKGELFFWCLHWYRRFSTGYMVYALSCEVLPLEWTLKSVLRVPGPGHCYLPGRFMLVEPLGRYASLVLSIFHICWRLSQRFKSLPQHVQLWLFLLHDEESITRLERQVEVMNYLCNLRKTRSPLRPQESLKEPLMALMYGQIQEPRLGTWWWLRGCRSAKERHRIALLDAKYMPVIYFSFCTLMTILMGVCIHLLLMPAYHHSLYPGCLAAGWTGGYRWLWLPFDLMENLCIQLDTVMAMAFCLPLAATLNSDLLKQWSQLETRMLSIRLKLLEAIALGINPMKLERLVVECQARLHDFFVQAIAADHLVSDILTTILLVLMVGYLLVDYYFIKLQEANEQFIILLGLLFLFVVFTIYSFICLSVHRATAASYPLMCFLMSLDQGRFKRRFIPLLDYYIDSNRCAYSMFRGQYAFVPTAYLTVIGWTLSAVTIINNLFKSPGANVT